MLTHFMSISAGYVYKDTSTREQVKFEQAFVTIGAKVVQSVQVVQDKSVEFAR